MLAKCVERKSQGTSDAYRPITSEGHGPPQAGRHVLRALPQGGSVSRHRITSPRGSTTPPPTACDKTGALGGGAKQYSPYCAHDPIRLSQSLLAQQLVGPGRFCCREGWIGFACVVQA